MLATVRAARPNLKYQSLEHWHKIKISWGEFHQWGSTTGNAATVVHSTKRKQSGKDSVIEGQPLLLFM
jgi:hypothetical protein